MSLAKTVDTTTAAVSRAVSSRRSLFGGAAAVVLGGGITAGVAASAADLVPGEAADAVLLALCARAEEQDRLTHACDACQHALQLQPGRASEARKARDQSDVHFDAFVELAEQAANIPALTIDGMRAKARVIYLNANTKPEADDLQALMLRDLGWGA